MARKGIIIVAALVLVVAGAGVALTVTGFLPKLLGMKPPDGTVAATVEKEKPAEPLVPERYYNLPPLIITLETQGRGNRILQLGLSILMETRDDASQVHVYAPLMIDAMQVYIRGLPLSETSSVAKLAKHRQEMLDRINTAIAPMKADELNFLTVQQQ
jgi:flagellar protein FliL